MNKPQRQLDNKSKINYWKAVACGSVLLGLFPYLSGLGPPTSSKKGENEIIQSISARQIDLVGKNGEVRVRITCGDNDQDPQIQFHYPNHDVYRVPSRDLSKPERQKNRNQPQANTGIRTLDVSEHYIREIIGNGTYVVLDNGTRWKIDEGEESQVESWGNVEVVLKTIDINGIRIYRLLNTEDREEVGVSRF